MKKILMIIICLVVGVLIYNKNSEIIIPSDAIRIRIIANSNSIKDLYEKKILKEKLTNELYSLINKVDSSIEASELIENNLNNINNLIAEKIKDYQINYGMNYFPKKIYKGVIYPEGEYKSLVITLGSGLGDNWWCVLYPPLCMLDDNIQTGDMEYRLLVSDILNN